LSAVAGYIGNMSNDVKPRVLIFSLAYFPLVGGAEIAVKEITDRLGDSFSFDLVTLRFDKNHLSKENIGVVNVFRVGGGKLIFPFVAFFLARKLHKKNNYNISWSIMAAYAGFGALFFKLLYPKIPMLLTLQEGDSEKHILKRVGIFYPFWKLIFKKADRIQAISNYLADFAKRYGAVCPIEVVPNGVNLDAYYKSNKTYKSDGAYTIITTSRLVYKNGVDILIRAVAELKRKTSDVQVDIGCPKVKLLILGDGPDRKILERLSVQLGVADVVKFIGHIDPELIPSYLSQADIFVRPSRSEGLGNSFLEAMAAGLPVIGTAVGGIQDFLKDGETGLVSRVDDPKDLADKIKLLFTDDILCKSISEKGKKLIWEKYSWDLVASQMRNVFKSIDLPRQSVLIAAGIYPPDVGGPATHAKKLAEGFKKSGFGVHIVTYGSSNELGVSSISRRIPFGLRHFIYFIKCLRGAVGCDIVYAQDATAAGWPAFVTAKILRRRLFIRIGGDVLWERVVEKGGRFVSMNEYYQQGFYLQDRPIIFRMIRMILRGANEIIVTTESLKDIYINFYSVDSNRIKVILNPIPNKQESFYGKEIFDQSTVLFAGRFVPYKNLRFLMHVFDSVRQKLNKGELYLIGDGPDKKELENFAADLASADYIKIQPAMLQRDLFEKIKSAAVCIGPALTEFNPNFILEGLSFGKPILLSRENGLSVKLPEDFIFDPKNEQELTEKLIKLLSDYEFYNRACKIVSNIEVKRSWGDVIEGHIELFRSAIKL